MEKNKKNFLNNTLLQNLPSLVLKKSSTNLFLTAKSHQNILSSTQFKDLRKLFFQYKSNAKNLLTSPYYSNREAQKSIVKLISNNKYDLSPEKQIQISKAFELSEAEKQEDHGKQLKRISITLKLCNENFKFNIFACSMRDLNSKIRMQMARIQQANTNEYKKCLRVFHFESINEDPLVDYKLSLKDNDLFLPEAMQIKPFYESKSNHKVMLSDFKFIKCLGSGGFSLVYLVKNLSNGQFYALKLINKNFILESERTSIVENQRFILGELHHPFVTQLKFAFQTFNHFAFVLQYCPGGELFYQLKKVKQMTEEQAKFYFLEILIGINYIHQKNMIYRDLKPENLILGSDGHIKIADFGLAKPLQERKTCYSFCGSPEYMAPEMLTKAGHCFTLDYYCLGALLYELVIGVPPYYSLNHEKIYNSIMHDDLSFPEHVTLSTEIKHLLSGLLQKNPSKRLGSLFGIKEILIHPWVGKVSIKTIEAKLLTPPFKPNLDQFNFDFNDVKEKSQEVSIKIQQDLRQPNFETYFNEEFYYEAANQIKRLKPNLIKKRVKHRIEVSERQNIQMKIEKKARKEKRIFLSQERRHRLR